MVVKNFTRRNLINKIFQNVGYSKNFSSIIVDDFFETLISELTLSNKIKISSFGTFKIINKKERVGRNPKTKREAKICARKVIKFKPSIIFKNKLNN